MLFVKTMHNKNESSCPSLFPLPLILLPFPEIHNIYNKVFRSFLVITSMSEFYFLSLIFNDAKIFFKPSQKIGSIAPKNFLSSTPTPNQLLPVLLIMSL